MTENELRKRYSDLVKYLIDRKITVSTMESCTGGQIASLITDAEGSSSITKGAFVTYSNEAKIAQGVPEKTIKDYGVYSKETALAMAAACQNAYKADVGIGITGTFGNVDLSNTDSIPGEVHFAVTYNSKSIYRTISLRNNITRLQSKYLVAEHVLNAINTIIKDTESSIRD
jgi:PncC family amidohydrolase